MILKYILYSNVFIKEIALQQNLNCFQKFPMQTGCNEGKPEFCRKIKISIELAAGFGGVDV
jgi:hypothetical protein